MSAAPASDTARIRAAANRAWTAYRELWRKGRMGIAVALLIPCFACWLCSAAASGLGLIDPVPTATPEPATTRGVTITPRPSATARPTRAAAQPTATGEPSTSTTVPATAAPVLPTVAPVASSANPRPDLSPDEDRNCGDFSSNDEAKVWYDFWRSSDRPNPGRLDGDGDGDICEQGASGGGGPAQIQPLIPQVPPPAPAGPNCVGSRTCSTFGSQGEAQAYWEACGRPSQMDRDNDGRVCESLP